MRRFLSILVVIAVLLSCAAVCAAEPTDVPAGSTVQENTGEVSINEGTIVSNKGRVETNEASGVIENNVEKGFVNENKGKIDSNSATEYKEITDDDGNTYSDYTAGVWMNSGEITDNSGHVSFNTETGEIGLNTGDGIIMTNEGTVQKNEADATRKETDPEGNVYEDIAAGIRDNTGTVTENSGRIEQSLEGGRIDTNTADGFVRFNGGEIGVNEGSTYVKAVDDWGEEYNRMVAGVETNGGDITLNEGAVDYNTDTGVIDTNNGEIGSSNGKIGTNNGSLQFNNRGWTEEFPDGYTETVSAGEIQVNNGYIECNEGTIDENGTSGSIGFNGGEIGTNNGSINANDCSSSYLENGKLDELLVGTVEVNNGTIEINLGTIGENHGVISENTYGYVSNEMDPDTWEPVETSEADMIPVIGTITVNAEDGVVEFNRALVDVNDGEVALNEGTVNVNNGTVYNGMEGVVNTDNGTVYNVIAYFDDDSYEPDEKQIIVNDVTKLLGAIFSRSGYKMSGWSDAYGLTYALNGQYKGIASIYMYPMWEKIGAQKSNKTSKKSSSESTTVTAVTAAAEQPAAILIVVENEGNVALDTTDSDTEAPKTEAAADATQKDALDDGVNVYVNVPAAAKYVRGKWKHISLCRKGKNINRI